MLKKIKEALCCYVFGHDYEPIRNPTTYQVELLTCRCCAKEVRL